MTLSDEVATLEGVWVGIDEIVETGLTTTVYNFRVADHHTYFLGDDTWEYGVWVHNSYSQKATVNGRKIYQRNDLFDPQLVDKNGLTNIQRMQSRKAPIGYDGDPINLHHLTGSDSDGLVELAGTFHADPDISRILHIPQFEKVGGVYVPRKNYSFRKFNGRKSTWPKTMSGKNYQLTPDEKAFIKWSGDYWQERANDFL